MDNLEKKSFLIKLNSIATDVPHTVIAFNYIDEYYKNLTDIEKNEFYDWAVEISHFIPSLNFKIKTSKTPLKANVGGGAMDIEQKWEIPIPSSFEFKEFIAGCTYYFFKYWIEYRTYKIEWVNNWLEEAKEAAQKKTDEETINIEKDLEFIPRCEQQAHLISLQKEWFKKFKTIKYNPEEKDFFHPEHWEIPNFEHSECTLPSTCYIVGSMFFYNYLGVVNWLKEKVEQFNDIQPQQNKTLPNAEQIFEEQAKDVKPQYIINESTIETFRSILLNQAWPNEQKTELESIEVWKTRFINSEDKIDPFFPKKLPTGRKGSQFTDTRIFIKAMLDVILEKPENRPTNKDIFSKAKWGIVLSKANKGKNYNDFKASIEAICKNTKLSK